MSDEYRELNLSNWESRVPLHVAGYRIARNLEAKLEWMLTDMEGPLDTRDDLVSMQLWWSY